MSDLGALTRIEILTTEDFMIFVFNCSLPNRICADIKIFCNVLLAAFQSLRYKIYFLVNVEMRS